MIFSLAIRRTSNFLLIDCYRHRINCSKNFIQQLLKINDQRQINYPFTRSSSSSGNKDDEKNLSSSSSLNKIYTIPNVLCMARIAITPLIGYWIINEHFDYALATCAISSITDFLDGWIARKYNSITKLGSLLDPLADKFLIASLTLTLTYVNLIPLWLTSLVFLRDLLIIMGGLWIHYRSIKPPPKTLKKIFKFQSFQFERYRPTMISKLNTTVQLILVSLSLASPVFMELFQQQQQQFNIILPILQYITGLTTFLSGIVYIKRLI